MEHALIAPWSGRHQCIILDNSSSASSEDVGCSRLDLARTLARTLVPLAASTRVFTACGKPIAAATPGDPVALAGAVQSLVDIEKDDANFYRSLRIAQMALSGLQAPAAALRSAAPNPCMDASRARRSPFTYAITAVICAPERELLSAAQVAQLANGLSGLPARLDVVVLGADEDRPIERIEDLVESLNNSARRRHMARAAQHSASTSSHAANTVCGTEDAWDVESEESRVVYVGPARAAGKSVPEILQEILQELDVGQPASTQDAGAQAGHSSQEAASSGRPYRVKPSAWPRSRLARTEHCRDESLDALQHLSVDGFMRSWLPSYSNCQKILQASSKRSMGGMGGVAHAILSLAPLCAVKQWTCLLSVLAGRVLPADSHSNSQTGSEAPASKVAPTQVMQPDKRKGRLAVLQSGTDEKQLVLVWQPIQDPASPYTNIWDAAAQAQDDSDDDDFLTGCDGMAWDVTTAEVMMPLHTMRSSFRSLSSQVCEISCLPSRWPQDEGEQHPGPLLFWLQQEYKEEGMQGAQALAHKMQSLARQPPAVDHRHRLMCRSAGSLTQMMLGDMLGDSCGLSLSNFGTSSKRKEAWRSKPAVVTTGTSHGRRDAAHNAECEGPFDLSSDVSGPPSPPARQSLMSSNSSSAMGSLMPPLPALLEEVVAGAQPAAAPVVPLANVQGSANATALWDLLQPKDGGGDDKPQDDKNSLLFDLD